MFPPSPFSSFQINTTHACVRVAVQREDLHTVRTILTWENSDPTSPLSVCQYTKWTQPRSPHYYILPPPPPWPSHFGAQQKIVSVVFKTEEKHIVFSPIFEPDVIAYRCVDLWFTLFCSDSTGL